MLTPMPGKSASNKKREKNEECPDTIGIWAIMKNRSITCLTLFSIAMKYEQNMNGKLKVSKSLSNRRNWGVAD